MQIQDTFVLCASGNAGLTTRYYLLCDLAYLHWIQAKLNTHIDKSSHLKYLYTNICKIVTGTTWLSSLEIIEPSDLYH